MKPDLRGVNVWGPGKYSELRKQHEIRDRKRPGEAAREALKEKRSKHRYLISINPQLAEWARGFGHGKLSTGINNIIHLAKMTGVTPVSDFLSGDIYETLNIKIAELQRRIELVEARIARQSKLPGTRRTRQIEFPQYHQPDEE